MIQKATYTNNFEKIEKKKNLGALASENSPGVKQKESEICIYILNTRGGGRLAQW